MHRGISVVTGGLGYIGQSIAREISARGGRPVIIDRRAIRPQVQGIPVIQGDIRDPEVWRQFQGQDVRAIFHCAGLIQVGESVMEPARYFDDNIVAGLGMLNHLRDFLGSVPIIFSSSAAVYGTPEKAPIGEEAPLRPESPYGVTKKQFEEILAAYHAAYGLPYVALRYFNAAGTDGVVRENHDPETHLLPRVARFLATGEPPVIYGDDYPTRDGTAVRDYIHIVDLVSAHLAALEYLAEGGEPTVINLGSGRGMSVGEMVQAFRAVVEDMPEPRVVGRRAGDPPVLVASIAKAQRLLAWRPQHSDPERLVREAWQGALSR
ncbi:UDP-glucose 4-epimerase GalE [Sulfobacillus harzensis]|uniref:UDP-glucose 4-epimerase n=1 Tax=Sulfobacillus harzensis TaxID=2729629 RepID=A0A7Y0L0M6_9FIRM|nr:UDP-glucose 4-epimerase GalE [Sulfobacillus harzensis]